MSSHKDFLTDAGLDRQSQRKSLAEKKLEASLNTAPASQFTTKTSPTARPQSLTSSPGKISPPVGEARLIQKLQSDDFVESAGLQRTSGSRKMSAVERALEKSLNTASYEEKVASPKEDHSFLIRRVSKDDVFDNDSCNRSRSISPPDGERQRKTSMYKLKNIEAPQSVKGNRISSRTQNLFKQYENDISPKRADPIRNEVEKELQEVQEQYKKSILQNERDIEEHRKDRLRDENSMKQANWSIIAV